MKRAIAAAAVLAAALTSSTTTIARADDNTGAVIGSIQDKDGHPISQALVTLNGPHAYLQTTTDKAGRFTFMWILPGSYVVYIDHRTIGTPCAQPPTIDVGPGLKWYLPHLTVFDLPKNISHVCDAPPASLNQLLSAGTTADMYLRGGDGP